MKYSVQEFIEISGSASSLGNVSSSSCCFILIYFISIGADRKQDEELDELTLSVQRIGGVGLTIHEELLGQVDLRGFLFSDSCYYD